MRRELRLEGDMSAFARVDLCPINFLPHLSSLFRCLRVARPSDSLPWAEASLSQRLRHGIAQFSSRPVLGIVGFTWADLQMLA